jgi:hypothetical protein
MSREPTPEELAMDGGIYDAHSWRPQNLIALAANPPEPPTIAGLLYPAKRTLLSGETESLKTWFALILAKAELDAGFAVAWADLDAMGAGAILERLQALGVADYVIAERFLYFDPEERLVGDRLGDVCSLLLDRAVRLFIIDAFNPILNLHGLDPNSTTDIEQFWRVVCGPICKTGAAPTLLDHVAKTGDRSAYGSERKGSGAHVHLGFQLKKALTRGGTGYATLTTKKDRGGHLPRPKLGQLMLKSDGEFVTYRLEPGQPTGDKFRPTVLMERVSDYLERRNDQVPRKSIEEDVTGDAKGIRTALDVLAEEEFVVETSGAHSARLYESIRPYRQADDEPVAADDDLIGASSVRHRCFELRSKPSASSVVGVSLRTPTPKREDDLGASVGDDLGGQPPWSDGEAADVLAQQQESDL